MPDVPVLFSTSSGSIVRSSRGIFRVDGSPWLFSDATQVSYLLIEDAEGRLSGVYPPAIKVTQGESLDPVVAVPPYLDAAEGDIVIAALPKPREDAAGEPAVISTGITRISPRALRIAADALPFPVTAAYQWRAIRSAPQAMRFGIDYAKPHFSTGGDFDGWIVATSDPSASFPSEDGLTVMVNDRVAPPSPSPSP